jgi:hypothetical protein
MIHMSIFWVQVLNRVGILQMFIEWVGGIMSLAESLGLKPHQGVDV